MPNLILNIARLFFILLGIAFVISTIWNIDLGQMLAALGVGFDCFGPRIAGYVGRIVCWHYTDFGAPVSSWRLVKKRVMLLAR